MSCRTVSPGLQLRAILLSALCTSKLKPTPLAVTCRSDNGFLRYPMKEFLTAPVNPLIMDYFFKRPPARNMLWTHAYARSVFVREQRIPDGSRD
jgi:hypothetical protein